jgi:sugar phosphate isomerase/epimerase
MNRPVSVSTVVYDGYPMDVAIADLAALGVHRLEPAYIKGYLEFDETAFSPAAAMRLRRILADNGAIAQAVSAHIDLGLPGSGDALHRRITFCRAIGCGTMITNSSLLAHRNAMLVTLETALPALEAADIVLALENPGHGQGNLLPDATAFAGLLGRFQSPHIRANYDIGNAFTYNEEKLELTANLVAALSWAAHLHAKDVRSDCDGWRFTALGDGSLDYRSLLQLLDQQAPALPLGIELPLRLDRTGRRDPQRRQEPLPLPAIRTAITRSLALFSPPAA